MTTLQKIRKLWKDWQDDTIETFDLISGIGDLLATKPEKECKHKRRFTGTDTCYDCGKYLPTPSPIIGSPYPLDMIEEIEEIDLHGSFTKEQLIKIGFDKTNEIIRNQKRIISYLKKR